MFSLENKFNDNMAKVGAKQIFEQHVFDKLDKEANRDKFFVCSPRLITPSADLYGKKKELAESDYKLHINDFYPLD